MSASSATPWTVAHQAPLSMGFPRQKYWSGLPCSPPGDLPDPGIKPAPSPTLAGGFFTTEPLGSHPENLPWLCTDKHTQGLYACAGVYTHLGTHVVSTFLCAHHGWPSSLQHPATMTASPFWRCSVLQPRLVGPSLSWISTKSLEVPLSLFSPQALRPLAHERVFLVPSQPCSSHFGLCWANFIKTTDSLEKSGRVTSPGYHPLSPLCWPPGLQNPKDFLLSFSHHLHRLLTPEALLLHPPPCP